MKCPRPWKIIFMLTKVHYVLSVDVEGQVQPTIGTECTANNCIGSGTAKYGEIEDLLHLQYMYVVVVKATQS